MVHEGAVRKPCEHLALIQWLGTIRARCLIRDVDELRFEIARFSLHLREFVPVLSGSVAAGAEGSGVGRTKCATNLEAVHVAQASR